MSAEKWPTLGSTVIVVLRLHLLTIPHTMVASADSRGRSPSPEDDEYAMPADYTPYVPVAKRRAQLLAQVGAAGRHIAKKIKTSEDIELEKDLQKEVERNEEARREKARRERTLIQEAQEVKRQKELEGACGAGGASGEGSPGGLFWPC